MIFSIINTYIIRWSFKVKGRRENRLVIRIERIGIEERIEMIERE
jgi:hypothetical protein